MSSATSAGDDRGRSAESPWAMPRSGWIDALKRTWAEASDDNLGLVAAGVAFYAFLAFVPLLAALVLSYGLVAEPETVVRHMERITEVVPADAARLIREQLAQVASAAQGEAGLGLLIALALALYGAMRGATAIMTALNIVYEEEDDRGFVKGNLVALAITAGLVLVAVAGLLLVSVLGLVDRLLAGAPGAVRFGLTLLSWGLAGLVAMAVIAAIYKWAPNRNPARWRWVSPGSAAATLGWLLATLGFGFYVASFGSYNATYGSLGAVVVLLMWLYLSAYVILLGAELNAELEHQTERDSTVGEPRPMGERGAAMADTLGRAPV